MKKNIFGLFIEKVLDFPLWVKQVIFLRLYQNLAELLSEDFIYAEEDKTFHLYIPTLTFKGRSELFDKVAGLDQNIYNFLGNINENLSMLEISLNNFWTMEETAKYFMFCLEQDYLKTPEEPSLTAMAGFMAGKYRIGEYYKRSGKINVDQLENAISQQRKLIAEGHGKKMGELLIELGYITKKDTKSLVVIKEEAKKRFILDTANIPRSESDYANSDDEYKSEIETLSSQNKILQDKLKILLEFIKKNANTST